MNQIIFAISYAVKTHAYDYGILHYIMHRILHLVPCLMGYFRGFNALFVSPSCIVFHNLKWISGFFFFTFQWFSKEDEKFSFGIMGRLHTEFLQKSLKL